MRKVWASALSLALGASVLSASAAGAAPRSDRDLDITLLATTDVHGNVQNWDYFKNQPYQDKYGNQIGLAQAATAIQSVRDQQGADSVVVVDNGDALQGTPLTYFYAKQEPVTESGKDHPMAVAYNSIGYDANNIGNHEFNYGLPLLDAYRSDLDSPLLAANVVDAKTGTPRYTPYTVVTRKVKGNKPVKVGILGLTTPGSMVWDKANLEGQVRIEDMVRSAKKWVPKVRAAGADVVVVLSHSGQGGLSSYDPAATGLGVENVSDQIAREVPGIDALVMGHSHQEVAQQYITNEVTGQQVLMTQPKNWAQSVSDVTFTLSKVKGKWQVKQASAKLLQSKDYAPDAKVLAALKPYHDAAVGYVNQVIATSTQELSAAESRYKDTAILDYIQMVQTQAVKQALAGGQYADLPVLSIAAPFSRTAVFPQGDVTVRDMAGLYIYDNTLEAVVMSGAQVKDYLEFSAKYFAQVPAGTSFDPETMTQVQYNGQTVWDYNYDVMSGVDYTIDLSQPVGQRITDLTLNGAPVDPAQQFVVAVNNYRRSGGGNYPHISTAPVVHQQQQEIRQLLIDWAQTNKVIDPKDFYVPKWHLEVAGQPIG
ncbi:bifunctional metallophosphatase/5'-nucleotidase [Luteococcus peritonei]|uniref:Bifunctional metallophosphatase/5'-nucleotidase n=1 Tax=Luteococcus peritonei TaxID=88874 RepID=A0ABW4RUW9_9ACTN